jgi:outer membrane lipoprotein LolB
VTRRRAFPHAGAAVVLACVWLLAGCAGRPSLVPAADSAALESQGRREARLAAAPEWGLHGRIAVSGGGDGGSGQLSWRQRADHLAFEMRAPVSRQTWRLTAAPGAVRLDGLDGGPRHGTDAEALLQQELGWTVPLGHLSAWVRGMRGEGTARIGFDAEGLPALIEQHGWRIEYRGWDRSSEPALPTRVFASRGEQRVRLAIARWDRGP